MEIFFTILILILVVSVSGVLTKMIPYRIPLPIIQIAMGALLAFPQFGLHVTFDPELFLVLLIPPLLFVDGWKTPTREFMQKGREIFILVLFLVLVTVIGIGYLIYWLMPGIELIPAFALAAVLSPTDAVALSSIVGKGRIPKQMMGILEGEALMNDASGLVALKFAVAIVMGTMIFSVTGVTLEFFKVAIGGLLAGVAVTWLYSKSLRLMSRWSGDDPATQIVFMLLLPFASYLIAEHIGVSGILAAVAAGMTISKSGVIRNAPLAMRLRADNVWGMLEFVFNGLVFIMLGLQLPGIWQVSVIEAELDPTVETWMLFTAVIVIYFALLVLRFCWLWMMKTVSRLTLKRKPLDFTFDVEAPCGADDCAVEAEVFPAISSYTVRLISFENAATQAMGINGLDAVDQWSCGFVQGDTYRRYASSVRSVATPALAATLEMPVCAGEPCIMIVDIWGSRRFYLPKRRY